MKMVIFDIDGTLLYTGGTGRIAFEKAFEELFGIPDVWQDLVPDGKTDPMIIDEIVRRTLKRPLTQPEYDRLEQRYHHYFDEEIVDPPSFRLLPGVTALLERLQREEEILLGIATGNFERAAWAKLKRGNIHSFFKFGGFASDHANRVELTRFAVERGQKLHGKKIPNECIFLIGDTQHDVHAGKTLGVQTVGVATGKTSVKDFHEKYQSEFALEDLSDADRFLNILGISS